MSQLSKARQRLAVAQGLALGAMMVPAPPIMDNKTTLEYAFRRAWRAWPDRDRFPSVQAGPRQDDIFLILGDEVRRGRRGIAWWESEWPFVAAADGEDWDELAELISGGVSATSWRELMNMWVAVGPHT